MDSTSTTNSVKAWHKNLNAKAVVKNTNLAKFVDLVQKEQILTEFKWIQLLNGGCKNTCIVICRISAIIVDN
jgi:hypothetical protein